MRTMLTTENVGKIIISDIDHTVFITFKVFWNFSKLQFVLHILAFTKFLLRWCGPWYLWSTLFKSSFPPLSTLCTSHLERFETFRNCSLFCTFWLLRSFYSHDARHGNYGDHCSNHHFRRWAHIVYHIYSVLKIIEITVSFAHFGFYEVSTPMMLIMVTMVNIVQIIISDVEHTLYITFTAIFLTFPNSSLTCTFWLLRSLYSGDAHHDNYGEGSSNHHIRHCGPFLYHIYSVLKLFEIAVYLAHFGYNEVSTPMMRTIVIIVNVVQIIISDVEHTLYITFIAFWKLSKLQFVLHILAFTKFLLRWCAPC